MDQIDALKEENYIDRDGEDITISDFGIEFSHVDFGYEVSPQGREGGLGREVNCRSAAKEDGLGRAEGNTVGRTVLKDVSFTIPEKISTASVDPENEHLIQEAISELTHGKMIITIAHRLATIENADQILVIDGGSVAQRGTH
ncbi:MAG: hypothetical protein NC121_14295 [Blautia sp.]|nr:hypothetical protein [Muribaculaceae bacterium]MCM1542412.1 hypothetical protein [Blautia sp.]